MNLYLVSSHLNHIAFYCTSWIEKCAISWVLIQIRPARNAEPLICSMQAVCHHNNSKMCIKEMVSSYMTHQRMFAARARSVCIIEPHGSANAVTKFDVASSHQKWRAADKQALDSGPGAAWQAGWSGLTNIKPLNLVFLGSPCTKSSRSSFAWQRCTVIIFRFDNSDVYRTLPLRPKIICMHDVDVWIHDLVEWSANMHLQYKLF